MRPFTEAHGLPVVACGLRSCTRAQVLRGTGILVHSIARQVLSPGPTGKSRFLVLYAQNGQREFGGGGWGAGVGAALQFTE